MDEKIAANENILKKSSAELEQFRTLIKKTSMLQEEIDMASVEIKNAFEHNSLSEEALKRFILLLNFMKPAMDECLKELTHEVKSSNAIIDVSVMKEFIKQEAVAYIRKAQEKTDADQRAKAKQGMKIDR